MKVPGDPGCYVYAAVGALVAVPAPGPGRGRALSGAGEALREGVGELPDLGRVVARDFGCSPEGLHAALIIKPVRRQRLPVLSSYDFVDRWVAGVEAWGVDTSAEPAIRRLMIAWDEGRDVRGTSLARLAGSWDYRPWDGGVQGDVVYEAETFSRASLTKHVAAITRDGAMRWPAAPAQPP